MNQEYTEKEKAKGNKILSFIFGIGMCLIWYFHTPKQLNISDFRKIEGTSLEDVEFHSGGKPSNNYFHFS